MRAILREVQDGTFAREWLGEVESGGARFEAMRRDSKEHLIEATGARLRGMMPWLRPNASAMAAAPATQEVAA